MTFKVLDLFCENRKISLGFEMAEFKISAGIEIEKDFLKSYQNAHPKTESIMADLSKNQINKLLTENNLLIDDIDVVIGGPPSKVLVLQEIE